MNRIVAFPQFAEKNRAPSPDRTRRAVRRRHRRRCAGLEREPLAASGFGLAPLRYALAHYVTTPCGGFAIPLLWTRSFARPLTGITPDSHPALWAEVAPDFARAARNLRRWRFSLDDAIAAARAVVSEGASRKACAARGVVFVPAGGPAPRPIVAGPVIHAFPIPPRTSAQRAA